MQRRLPVPPGRRLKRPLVPALPLRRIVVFVALLLGGLAGLVQSLTHVYASAEVVPTPANTEVLAPRLAGRVLLIVVDGLRYDTAFESGAMPRLQALRARGASGVSLATEITMTGVGVRTIGTGVASGTWVLARYWDLPPVAFDDVFGALHRRGDRVIAVGNSAWGKMFGGDLDIDESLTRITHFFHYMNPVWGADMIWVKRALGRLAEPSWTMTVVHLGGLDNASHLWTPTGARFFDKAHQIDEDVARLVEAAGPTTTVIITSDHGSSDSGHHGSGELVARRSPLAIVGPHIVPGAVLEANQVDLAPTIAVLLGLPRPAPAEGRVLAEALQLDDAQRAALTATELVQVQRYADAWAQANHVAPPKLADVRELPAWLDGHRDVARLAPLAWGLALLILCGYAVWQRDRARPSRMVLVSLVPLFALEAAALWWRLHHRWMEIALGHLEQRLPVGSAVLTGVVVLACIAAGLALRRRSTDDSSPTALLVLFAFALLGDTLTPWGALAVGAIAMYTTRRAFALDLLLLALFVGSRFLEHVPSWHHVGAVDLGVLVLVAYALARRAHPLVLVAAVGVLLVHHLGSPVWPFRLLWMATLALGLLGVRARTPRAALAIVAALAMSLLGLSHEQHALGIVLLSILAWRAGRSAPGPLRAAVLVVALRIGFVSLFERGWSVSRLEVWLGYVGNPGQSWFWGGAALVVKMVVPLALALLAVTANNRAARSRTMLFVIAAFVFRIAHALVWMTVARHTFYGPFVDVGFLLFFLIFVAISAVLYCVTSVRGEGARDTMASP